MTVCMMQYFGGPKCVSHDKLAVEPAECGGVPCGLPLRCLLYRLEVVRQKAHAGMLSFLAHFVVAA